MKQYIQPRIKAVAVAPAIMMLSGSDENSVRFSGIQDDNMTPDGEPIEVD